MSEEKHICDVCKISYVEFGVSVKISEPTPDYIIGTYWICMNCFLKSFCVPKTRYIGE